MFLHGWGQDLRHWSFLQDVLDLPWLEMVLLEAPVPAGNGRWSWFASSRECGESFRSIAELERDTELVEEALAAMGTPAGSTVLGGFSQGAAIALELGLRSPREWAGILCVSGCSLFRGDHPPSPHAATRRYLCTHGDQDGILPLEHAAASYARIARMGVPLACEVFRKDHGLDPCEERRRIRSWLEETLSGGGQAAT